MKWLKENTSSGSSIFHVDSSSDEEEGGKSSSEGVGEGVDSSDEGGKSSSEGLDFGFNNNQCAKCGSECSYGFKSVSYNLNKPEIVSFCGPECMEEYSFTARAPRRKKVRFV